MEDNAQISTLAGLVKAQQGSFFGKYRGVVIDNADPRNRGRLLVEVPSVLGTGVHKWAVGQFALGGNASEAAIFVPAVGSQVFVEFVEGSPKSPVWVGVYYPDEAADGSDQAPPESFDQAASQMQMIRTASGIELRLEDDRQADSHQQVVLKHPKGAELRIDPAGVITLTDAEGAELILDPENGITRLKSQGDGVLEMTSSGLTLAHGSTKLELTSSGVTVTGGTLALDGDQVTLGKSASASIMNAQAFIDSIFSMHTHVAPPTGGPTGPPVPPGSPSQAVSLMKVKGA